MADDDKEPSHQSGTEESEESDEELKPSTDTKGGDHVGEKASGDAEPSMDDEEKQDKELSPPMKEDKKEDEEEEESIAGDDTPKSPVEKGEEKHDSDGEGKESEPKDAATGTPTEKDDEKDEIIECPLIADILVGRGKQLKQHPGNQRMVAIIAIHRLRYQDANEEGKKEIIDELTSEVQRGGTRFLKVNDNGTGWMKCSADEVKAKGAST